MKKILFVAMASLTLVACSPAKEEAKPVESTTVEQTTVEETTLAPTTQSVTINISEDGKPVENGTKEIEIKEGAKLLDVMKENFEIEEKDGFINSINGIKQSEADKKYWMFDVNGSMSDKGAADLELKAGDVIDWKLEVLK